MRVSRVWALMMANLESFSKGDLSVCPQGQPLYGPGGCGVETEVYKIDCTYICDLTLTNTIISYCTPSYPFLLELYFDRPFDSDNDNDKADKIWAF
jgi:hypothetical protein